ATFASPNTAGTQVVVYSLAPQWVADPRQAPTIAAQVDGRFADKQSRQVDPAVPLELLAVPACSVNGRLLQANGRAAPFVKVEIQEETPNRARRWLMFASAVTDREGPSRLDGLHPLRQAVRLHVDGSAGSCTGEPMALAEAGKAIATGDLTLSPPATIE